MAARTPFSPEAVLRWYLDAGVDEAIRENPVDRYAAPPPAAAVAHPESPDNNKKNTIERPAPLPARAPLTAQATAAMTPPAGPPSVAHTWRRGTNTSSP